MESINVKPATASLFGIVLACAGLVGGCAGAAVEPPATAPAQATTPATPVAPETPATPVPAAAPAAKPAPKVPVTALPPRDTPDNVEDFARAVAAEGGLDEAEVLATLRSAKVQQGILDAISRPAEAKPWKDYRPIFLTDKRIADGAAFYRANREIIEKAAADYRVAPEIIVAIIGVETSYGRNTGKYRVLDALVTLGFHYPPRAKFFRGELRQLFLLRDKHLAFPIDELTGSYAGAMGWGQFIPTSVAHYAVDYDGDGRIDLWNSLPDIVGSVANYFAQHGWIEGAPVATRTFPTEGAEPPALSGMEPVHTVGALRARGYVPVDTLDDTADATLLTLEGIAGPEQWITLRNFYVISRYNRSPLYSMAVYQLSQQIAAEAAKPAP